MRSPLLSWFSKLPKQYVAKKTNTYCEFYYVDGYLGMKDALEKVIFRAQRRLIAQALHTFNPLLPCDRKLLRSLEVKAFIGQDITLTEISSHEIKICLSMDFVEIE